MRRLIAVAALLLLIPVAVPASEFDWLVREVSRQSGAKPEYIPFFGLVRFAVAVGHPAGTSELKIALFEHTSLNSQTFSGLMDTTMERDWKPMVRVRSRKGESTNIYAQVHGKELRLLIASLDGGDATLMQVRVRPEELMKFIDEHQGSNK